MEFTKHHRMMLRIIGLFLTVMLLSFIPEEFRNFFGDEYCKIPHHEYAGNYHDYPEWHWGYRHFIWLGMGICLFIYNAVLIISDIQD